jgi:hypothetical protein
MRSSRARSGASGSVCDRPILILLIAMTMTSCGDQDRPGEAAQQAAPPPDASAPVAEAPAVDAMLSDTGLVAMVRRGPLRRYSISGETRAADALQLTLEDGERVLYGPTELEVQEGHFHLEFVSEPSERTQKTVYLTTGDGARQWVIALPADSVQIRFREP